MTVFFLCLVLGITLVLLAEWWALDQIYDALAERKSTKKIIGRAAGRLDYPQDRISAETATR